MIWVFDSWMWGLLTLQYLQEELPQAQFLYLGDTKYVPYGAREQKWIHDRTFECLEWMFDQWCSLVILACNTASAYAIRSWQEQFPDKKALSVTIPGVEAVVKWWYSRPLLFATQATVQSYIYPSVMKKLTPDYDCTWNSMIWAWVVKLIENWVRWDKLVEMLEELFSDVDIQKHDVIVLWCTHYPLIQEELRKVVWEDIAFIDAGAESAHALVSYLDRHDEIKIQEKISDIDNRLFVTELGNADIYEWCELLDL